MNDQSFVIVGQGIAGTCMAHELIRRGASVQIFDSESMPKATLRAAGVINPITGRRFVKTWEADTLLELARSFYGYLESLFETTLLTERQILHALDSPYMEENWAIRQGDDRYLSYLGGTEEAPYSGVLKPRTFAVVNGALQVDIMALMRHSRTHFEELGVLTREVFSTDQIASGKKVIYCEGVHVRSNSLFSPLENMFAKGEALVCRIPDLVTSKIIKNGIVIAPYRDGLRWIGSTYNRDDAEPIPTPEGRERLSDGIADTLDCNWTIEEHIAGIRPTTVDRRPYIGKHPERENVFLLNGLGAKGASLAPYGAKVLADHIEHSVPIPREVDILRYWR